MKKLQIDRSLGSNRLIVWLGLRETDYLLAGLELTTLLQKLDPFIRPRCARICHYLTCLHSRRPQKLRIPLASRTEG